MKVGILLTFFFFHFCINCSSQTLQTEERIENRLNKSAYSKVIEYYKSPKDSLKLKAFHFLAKNMSIHSTNDYVWVDRDNEVVQFNELEHNSFNESLIAFKALKREIGDLKAVPRKIFDVNDFSSMEIIQNIEQAFAVWNKENYSFEIFCEYILPYRISVEPLHDWRTIYKERFSKLLDDSAHLEKTLELLKGNLNLWFVCTYGIEKRTEPLPRLGALQLLHRKKGTCEDVANLSVFALRSVGVPATIDFVPYWATSTGNHTLNCAFRPSGKSVSFDILSQSDSLSHFIREPGKVLRFTYSIQGSTLAERIPIDNIPLCHLRLSNYLDVTEQYWKTSNINIKTYELDKDKIVYACVLNGGLWKPVWWGESSTDSVEFNNVSIGAVYLPKVYQDGKMQAVGYPFALGYQKSMELVPSKETHTIYIKEIANYLKFRPGKKYRLAYYDFGWQPIGTKVAGTNTEVMVFEDVPKNALLLLVPNFGERKERPFTIDENGTRNWW